MNAVKTALILVLFLTTSSSIFLLQCSGEKAGGQAGKREEAAAIVQQDSVMAHAETASVARADTAAATGVAPEEKTASQAPAQAKKQAPKIKVTFVELGSVNCIPCKMMQPVMKEIEEQYGDQVKVVFHDVWTEQGQPYARQYGVRAIPTQVFLDENGKEYHRHTGFFPKEELVKILAMKGVK